MKMRIKIFMRNKNFDIRRLYDFSERPIWKQLILASNPNSRAPLCGNGAATRSDNSVLGAGGDE